MIRQLGALAQATRLSVFRTLIRAGADGVSAGRIATELGVAPNTLSSHLSVLERAGLIRQRRDGRSVIYSVAQHGVAEMLDAMIRACCAGNPCTCVPLFNSTQTIPGCVRVASQTDGLAGEADRR